MQSKKSTPENNKTLINNLVELVGKGSSHASLDDALKNMPFALLGERPQNLPYSIWQLAEHIRIAQWDILEFCRDPKHVSPKWPDEYWPKEAAPKQKTEWQQCVNKIKDDRKAFIELIKKSGNNLDVPFEHGTGQSLQKEALVLADHNSYHTGEIIIIRRLLKAWD